MKSPIFIAGSPNTQNDDFMLAVKLICQPWKWQNRSLADGFERDLKNYLSVGHVHTADSGRSALYLLLKALGIGENDEVILPSFTCLVVANAVRWTGAVPVYIDTSHDDFNIDIKLLEAKISKETKAIVVQHTFGKILDIERIRSILSKKNRHIFIIEDWAHTFSRNFSLGGDAAFLTFGIEKLLSGVRGGAVVTNDPIINDRLKVTLKNLSDFGVRRTFVALTNPIFWHIDTPLHAIGYKQFSLGAGIRWLWRKLGFLGNMIEKKEHMGLKPGWLPTKISPVLAKLAHNQLKKYDKFNEHRTKLAKIYHNKLAGISDSSDFDSGRVYLRYPILLRDKKQRQNIWNLAKILRITIGDWYKVPLYSKKVDKNTYKRVCYVPSSTPVTLDKCSRVLNLPTGVNMTEDKARVLAEKIAENL